MKRASQQEELCAHVAVKDDVHGSRPLRECRIDSENGDAPVVLPGWIVLLIVIATKKRAGKIRKRVGSEHRRAIRVLDYQDDF